jgi:peptidoglycan/xylan/chitin deacetylase (PgdA/CDA1 family)
MKPQFLTLPYLMKYLTIVADLHSMFSAKTKKNVRIINYHSVRCAEKIDLYDVSEENFYNQMNVLKNYLNIPVKALNLENLKSHNGLFITFDDGYSDNLNYALPLLEKFNFPFTVYVISDFIKKEKKGFLTKEELKKITSSKLVSIGSHSVTHKYLTHLSIKDLKRELIESKKYLEDTINKPIDSFAYPFGDANKMLANIVEECGYKFAVTTYPGNNSSFSNKFLLNRNVILSHDNIKTFTQKIHGNWDWTNLFIKNPSKN